MSGFLLDTNVPSEVTHTRPDPRVTAWLRNQDDGTLYVSVVTIGELRRGFALQPVNSERRRRLERWLEQDLLPWFEGRILPVTKPIAERWGLLDAQCQLRGTPANTADGLIAATALDHGLSVVTRNVKDFMGLGVQILNPWEI